MPVSFLSSSQRESYGRYVGDPSPQELARYFHLDDANRAQIAEKRGQPSRLRPAAHHRAFCRDVPRGSDGGARGGAAYDHPATRH